MFWPVWELPRLMMRKYQEMNESHNKSSRDDDADSDPSLLKNLWGKLRGGRRHRGNDSVRETLEELIEERIEAETPIDAHEHRLLDNILHLRDVTAADVMIPRADIAAIDVNSTFEEAVAKCNEIRHSRLPVYRETLDEAIGMLHIKDLFRLSTLKEKPALSRVVRRILFVAPSMRLLDLLLEMRLKRTHMALVVDEYGGIDGLVTIEDLIEQIVGEIQDEHDHDDPPDLAVRPDGVIEADARTSIEEFEKLTGPVLTEEEREDVDTLGGLVSFIEGRVPSRGELIHHSSGLEFEIADADPRRIKWLRVRRPQANNNDETPSQED